MPADAPFLLGFAAYSGTGKTTLLSQVIPKLRARGLSVGVIKHSHHDFDVDQPGKDSYRLRTAGATPVMLVSPYRRVVISELAGTRDCDLMQELKHFPIQDLDLVLVEGFRQAAIKKIELHRRSLETPLLYPNDPYIVAIASDVPLETPERLRLLDLNCIESIVDFIFQLIEAQ